MAVQLKSKILWSKFLKDADFVNECLPDTCGDAAQEWVYEALCYEIKDNEHLRDKLYEIMKTYIDNHQDKYYN